MADSATKTKIARSAAPPVPSLWQRYKRAWIAAGAVAIGAALYFGGGAFVAYTSDAYVRSDLVAIAPEVPGIVKTVSVQDNQKIATGDPIAMSSCRL